jgi:2',3'-cyclic-nucleotide 2'-phosphodiesterase (5'-nucleotidase family)
LPFNCAKDAIKFLHFNDVYEIDDPDKGDGGAARFVTALNESRAKVETDRKVYASNNAKLDDLTVFCGDLLSPSMMGAHYRGTQMIGPFNACKVDVAMVGNHDLDFGIL